MKAEVETPKLAKSSSKLGEKLRLVKKRNGLKDLWFTYRVYYRDNSGEDCELSAIL